MVVDGVVEVTGAVVVTGVVTAGVTGAIVATDTGAVVVTGTVGVVTAAAGAARVVDARASKAASSTAVHCLWDLMILLAKVSQCSRFGCLSLHAEGACVTAGPCPEASETVL